MERSPQLYLSEVKKVTDYLVHRTGEATREEYLHSQDLQYIVERGFILIGEAMVLLRRNYPEVFTELEDHAAAIGFRNFIVHQYWNIDNRAVWDTLKTNLGPLDRAVELLLAKLDAVDPG
jgi:uncharacterized protein with HEPN domain